MSGSSTSSERTVDSSAALPPAVAPERTHDSETLSSIAPQTSADSAVSIICDYYRAIDGHQLSDAYMMWSDSGRASKKSLAEFTRGFAETSYVSVSNRIAWPR